MIRFVFETRPTGKTTLILRQQTKTATIVDLLDSRYLLKLSGNPLSLT